MTALCTRRTATGPARSCAPPAAPRDGARARWLPAAPPMTGAEYLTPQALEALWDEIGAAFGASSAESQLPVQEFLKRRNPAWNLVGRVHFNLAENRRDERGAVRVPGDLHDAAVGARQGAAPAARRRRCASMPARRKRRQLLSLLLPVQRAAEQCALAEGDGRRGRDLPPAALDAAARRSGCSATCRRSSRRRGRAHAARPGGRGRPPRPQVTRDGRRQAAVRRSARTRCSISAWRSRSTASALTRGRDRRRCCAGTDGLALDPRPVGRGRPRAARAACSSGSSEAEQRGGRRAASRSPRRCACSPGADVGRASAGRGADPDWSRVVAGPWLAETLAGAALARTGLAQVDPGARCTATLRPYQQVGVRWLHLLLAARPRRLPRRRHGARQDDPGAGAAARAEAERAEATGARPSLLVAPASLLANWAAEIERFAPEPARARRAPVGDAAPTELRALDAGAARRRRPGDHELRLAAARCPGSRRPRGSSLVLDEAQAIKNPGAQADARGQEARARGRASR